MKSFDSETLETLQIGMTASARHLSGTDRYYLQLLRHLPDYGVNVRGMVLGEPAAVSDATSAIHGFAREGSSRMQRWSGARKTFKKLLDGTDLIVSHGQPHAFPVLDLVGKRPLVVQFHGPWALEGKAEGVGAMTTFVRRLQELAVYRRAVRFITLSRSYADVLVASYGVDRKIIRVVPGGVDFARFSSTEPRATARSRIGLPLERPLIVTTRRLEPSKGIAIMIEAMDAVRAAIPDALLAIAGTGTLSAELEQMVESRNLSAHVRFLGHVSEERLTTLYRAADVCVVPSVAWEGFGLSVVEALASGTPTIVTDLGGLPEVVRDLDPCLIVPPQQAAPLAERIVGALRGQVPSEADCAQYARRFDWPVIARRIAGVYREVSGRK